MRVDHPFEPSLSDETTGARAARTTSLRDAASWNLTPDTATCAACLEEVRTPTSRRHKYPFASCAACGPRYAIATGLPYDRRHTSMRTFVMCDDCAREYDDAEDRRHRAQPIACPACGPALSFRDRDGRIVADGDAALDAATRVLRDGGIVALRSGSGFQLLCDATSPQVVWTLRSRKRTPLHQPFAVMFRDLAQLEASADVSPEEARALRSSEAPIVLVARRETSRVPEIVAPGSRTLGAMLPSSALHALLLDGVDVPLVCTSGNVSGEPMCTSTDDASERLASIADGMLCHDLPIVRPLEDSVVQVTVRGSSRRTTLLRRGRGFVPRSVGAIDPRATVLALGARRNGSVTLGHRGALVPSQHLGDVESLRGRELLEATVRDMCALFDADPTLIACDLRSDCASTVVAQQHAERWGVPLLRVQHHHAHVAAAMAEHGAREDDPFFGIVWDGPELGPDGTLWGGEAFVCQAAEVRRVGTLRSFPLLGGDRAAREPRRSALGLVFEVAPAELSRCAGAWTDAELASCAQILERQLAPMCSSVERLFDAVAAMIGLSTRTTFEGQAAAELARLAASVAPDGAYPLPIVDDGVLVADTRPLVGAILEDVRARVDRPRIARRFHEALVELGVALAQAARVRRVVLTGSVFQNRLLADALEERLEAAGFVVLLPASVPTNDGGVSVGQAWLAAQHDRGGVGRS